jgi:hypothetical protein
MMNDDECGAVGGMIGRGNRSTRRRPTHVALYPPQIPHKLNRALARATAVEAGECPCRRIKYLMCGERKLGGYFFPERLVLR